MTALPRVALAALVVALLAGAAATVGGAGATRTIPLMSSDGGFVPAKATAGGIARTSMDGMCFSSTCAEESASTFAPWTNYLNLSPRTWYEVTSCNTNACDGTGGMVACLNVGSAIVTAAPNDAGIDAGATCYGKPKVLDGTAKPMAFAGTIYCLTDAGCTVSDAGATTCSADVGCVDEAHVYVHSFQSTGGVITACPEVPCN